MTGAAVAALAALASLALLSRAAAPAILPYVLILSGGAALVTALAWNAPPAKPRFVLLVALLLHGVALYGVPAFEDDHYRFIWDGWQVLTFGTPYGVAPAAFFSDVQVPLALRAILDGVNNPDIATIYGPALQLLFGATYALAGTDLLGLRVVFALVNLLLIAVMLRRYPAERVALYAWNPLMVSEVALHVHPDGIMAAALFGGVMLLRARPALAGVLFGLAVGVKLVAFVAWPLLLRSRPAALIAALATSAALYAVFLAQGAGAGFATTATFASRWHFNPIAYEALSWILRPDPARLIAAAIAGIGVLWFHARAEGRNDATLASAFGLILLFASAVNSWYLLWLLPFAVNGRKIWPFAATVALPFSYFTGLNLGDEVLGSFEVHIAAQVAEICILAGALIWDFALARRKGLAIGKQRAIAAPIQKPVTSIIIPALNEEASVGGVIAGLFGAGIAGLERIIVVDNGSTDNTAAVARAAGAFVASEPERGYGAACLAGLGTLPPTTNIILFADADGSDVPQDAARLVAVIASGGAAMAIGSRMLGEVEPGAMTLPQRFGNWLAPLLIRAIWDVRFTDLGPLRAIRRDALDKLTMEDRNFGWTVEMQVRAAKLGIASTELAVGYRKRIGISKISGTLSGVFGAGTKILFIVAREAFGDFGARSQTAQYAQ